MLNSAYGDWGDEKIFRWKYEDYPDFREDQAFFVENIDGGIKSFGRVASREIIFSKSDERIKTYTLGDAAVDPDYQGEGLYSDIHKARTEYAKKKNSQAVLAFVRKTNISYKVNKKRGWGDRELPLHMLILSPAKSVKTYAELAIVDMDFLKTLCKTLGNRINLVFGDGNVILDELVEPQYSNNNNKISISFSDHAVKKLIEEVNENLKISKLFNLCLRLLMDGDIVLGKNKQKNFTFNKREYKDLSLIRKDNLTKEELDGIMFLYSENLNKYDIFFRRERGDIEHMLSHPNIKDVLLIKKDNQIVGFALLVSQSKKADSKEIWVYDWIWKDYLVKDMLLNEIENIGNENNVDAVLVISDLVHDEKWTYIGHQAITWNIFENQSNLEKQFENMNWRIALYDIL